MKKLLAIMVCLLIIQFASMAHADVPFIYPERSVGVWVEGSHINADTGNGNGIGLGFRLGLLGLSMYLVDTSDKPDSMKVGVSSYPGIAGGTPTGQKVKDGMAYGFDFDLHFRVGEYVTAYGGGGIAIERTMDVYAAARNDPYQGIATGEHYAARDHDHNTHGTWNAGTQVKIPITEKGTKLVLGAGYHSWRGVLGTVGLAW